MELDLVTERNIELFMRLAELSEQPITPCMSWWQAQFETYLGYQNGRVYISQLFPQMPFNEVLLRQGLSKWQPAHFYGIPQRVFHLRQGMVISCSPPANSLAELWLALHRRQKAFMGGLCTPA